MGYLFLTFNIESVVLLSFFPHLISYQTEGIFPVERYSEATQLFFLFERLMVILHTNSTFIHVMYFFFHISYDVLIKWFLFWPEFILWS